MSKLEKSKPTQGRIPQSSISELQNVRIIQKNLLYVIGLSSRICDRELLMKKEYFGQYGKIKRLVVNNSKAYNPDGMNGPSFSAYISFSSNRECSLALLSIDNTVYDGHLLKASFGSTKYCLHYLRNIDCFNKDCLFLHSLADEKDIINKDESYNKNIFLQNQYLAIKISDILNQSERSKIIENNKLNKNTEFPSTNSIFSKEIFREAEIKNKKQKYNDLYEIQLKETESNEFINIDYKKANDEDPKNLSNNFIISEITKSVDDNLNCLNNDLVINREKIDMKLERKASDISICSEKTFNTDPSVIEKKRMIFCKKLKSRFDFGIIYNTEEDFNIPEYISSIISFKTSTYFYLKNVELDEYFNKNKLNLKELKEIANLTEKY